MKDSVRDSVIVQASWGDSVFQDMMRLAYQRHAAYSRAHDFDYWHINGNVRPDTFPGGWDKIYLIKSAMDRYKYVVWIDADAAIFDFEADLRDALKDKPFDIGACIHDAPWFKENGMEAHMNVGVLYVRTTDKSKKFMDDWFATYPGDRRWQEQGAFNELANGNDLVGAVEDKWNSTVNVNLVKDLVVKGYHGAPARFNLMKQDMLEDHIIFRV